MGEAIKFILIMTIWWIWFWWLLNFGLIYIEKAAEKTADWVIKKLGNHDKN